jgi:hypothetical protein
LAGADVSICVCLKNSLYILHSIKILGAYFGVGIALSLSWAAKLNESHQRNELLSLYSDFSHFKTNDHKPAREKITSLVRGAKVVVTSR